MKKNKILILLLLIISACGGLSDAKKVLKNEKIITTDEFLVKKKEPLILPPDFEKLPLPDSKGDKNISNQEKEKIKKILRVDENNQTDKKPSSSIEKSIIEKIQ